MLRCGLLLSVPPRQPLTAIEVVVLPVHLGLPLPPPSAIAINGPVAQEEETRMHLVMSGLLHPGFDHLQRSHQSPRSQMQSRIPKPLMPRKQPAKAPKTSALQVKGKGEARAAAKPRAVLLAKPVAVAEVKNLLGVLAAVAGARGCHETCRSRRP